MSTCNRQSPGPWASTATYRRPKRDRLIDSLEQRLTGPTAASTQGRSAQYQQQTDAIRKELKDITGEIESRSGTSTRRPIYLV